MSGMQLQDLAIWHYIDDTLLEFWFPKAIYTTTSNFIWNHKPDLCTEDQTTLIPWVQSIVIKHYILGKEVFFWGQDNYIGLYRYLDDFVALYLTYGWIKTHHWLWHILMTRRPSICRKRSPKSYTLCQSWTCWLGPWKTAHHFGEGFIVPLFNEDVLLHDYQLHWNNTTTIQNYQLQNFLQTGGIEPLCDDSENSSDLFGSN
jgi:hypothetical protein